MAVLSAADRLIARHACVAENTQAFALIKTDLLAAVDAADTWLDANAAAFNAALPLPARTALSAKQKALLLAAVIRRRFAVI